MKRILITLSQKWPEYLLEILVLIIGIYGAFMLDNWNQQTDRRSKEISMLKNLKNNLQKDTSDLNYNLNRNKEILVSQLIILEFLDQKIDYSDSLSYHFPNALAGTTFVSNEGAFETLKSVGVDLVSNEDLLQNITELYDMRYEYYNKVNTQYIESWFLSMPTQSQHFKEWKMGQMNLLDTDRIQSDASFRYYLGTLTYLNKSFLITICQTTLSHAETLIQQIEAEINRLEQ